MHRLILRTSAIRSSPHEENWDLTTGCGYVKRFNGYLVLENRPCTVWENWVKRKGIERNEAELGDEGVQADGSQMEEY